MVTQVREQDASLAKASEYETGNVTLLVAGKTKDQICPVQVEFVP
jgi:hypothetical protein